MRDIMRHRGRLILAITLVSMLVSMALPGVNAEVFDIGSKISESDQDRFGSKLVYFDTGGIAITENESIDYISLILDGNITTGIDHDFGSASGFLWIGLYFPYAYNVSNITIKPTYGGGTSNYTFGVYSGEGVLDYAYKNSTEQMFEINGKITGIYIWIYKVGTNHIYFNDLIINYTPGPSNLTNVIAAIDILTNTVNSLQNQINNLNQQIAVMNDTINSLNQNQLQILNDLTSLQSNYNQLNNSLMDLFNEIENLNITANENITLLNDNLNLIESKIDDIYLSLEDLTTNVTDLSELQNLINQTTQDIMHLNENLTEIKDTMPSEYDDTALTTRVFQLESENAALSNDIQNLTEEIENLKEEPDDFVPLGTFVVGIFAILIAIVAVILATRKSEPEKPPEENEESKGDEDKVSEEDLDSY